MQRGSPWARCSHWCSRHPSCHGLFCFHTLNFYSFCCPLVSCPFLRVRSIPRLCLVESVPWFRSRASPQASREISPKIHGTRKGFALDITAVGVRKRRYMTEISCKGFSSAVDFGRVRFVV